MDVRADLTATCDAARLFAWVDDLDRYPEWMQLVHSATSVPTEAELDGVGGPAWTVELRARVGPLARSKRLRMVRVVHDDPTHVVFERREADGRRHSPWVLDVRLTEVGAGETRLDMHLHYGGGLWTGGVMERILGEEIDRGRNRLLSLVSPTR